MDDINTHFDIVIKDKELIPTLTLISWQKVKENDINTDFGIIIKDKGPISTLTLIL